MSILAQYERQATILNPKSPSLKEVLELRDSEQRHWMAFNGKIRESGVPTMTSQPWRSLVNNIEPPLANQTTVAAAADTILWDAPNLSPFPAKFCRADEVYKITAWGITTTAVTGSQTLIITPRFGVSTAGTSLGVSRTALINAAVQTNVAWNIEMWVHFRSIGAAGTATCSGIFNCVTAVGTAATTNTCPVNFGTTATTATTVDTTAATCGLVVSVNASLATQTFTTMGVVFESLN